MATAFGHHFLNAIVPLLLSVAAGIVTRAGERDADNTNSSSVLCLIADEAERTLREIMRLGFEKIAYVMGRAKACAEAVEAFIGRSQANVVELQLRR